MKTVLLEDVNLANIQFGNDGKSVHFDFLDMYEGKSIGSMICEEILHFTFSNCFNERDCLACYIGEVTVQVFTLHNDIEYIFDNIKYRFSEAKKSTLDLQELYFVEIEGGEISIEILCCVCSGVLKGLENHGIETQNGKN